METANISHRAIGADEKAFIGDSAEKFAQKTHGITLKNMRHALQLIYRKTDGYTLLGCRVRAKGALENYITIRVAANVPADVVPNAPGDFLLFDTPGLCPDRLEPIEVPQGIALRPDYTVSVFVTFELDGQAAAGGFRRGDGAQQRHRTCGGKLGIRRRGTAPRRQREQDLHGAAFAQRGSDAGVLRAGVG